MRDDEDYKRYAREVAIEDLPDPKEDTTRIMDLHTPGAKADHGKPDLSLLLFFGKALQSVAAVGTFGARKYSRGGWQHVDDGVNRYTAALLRHITQENAETNDKESGFAHAAHAAWNALARLELMIRESEKNK